MNLTFTLEQVEVLFDVVRSACPDERDGNRRTEILYALDEMLEEAAGYAPPKAS